MLITLTTVPPVRYKLSGGIFMELKKHIIDEKTGISYTLCGDYYLPDLALLEEKYYEQDRNKTPPVF